MISFVKRILSDKKWAVCIAIIWTALILFACFIPSDNIPKVNVPLMDKWVHFVIFAGFSFLWLCVWQNANAGPLIIIFVLSVALGYSVELIQGSNLVRGRSYETNDVIADAIGGALGCVLYKLFNKKLATKK